LFQDRQRERAAQAAGRSEVEPRPLRVELLHEPVAFLVERQRPVPLGRGAGDAGDRWRFGGAGGLPLLLAQLLEQGALLGGKGGDAVGEAHTAPSPSPASRASSSSGERPPASSSRVCPMTRSARSPRSA